MGLILPAPILLRRRIILSVIKEITMSNFMEPKAGKLDMNAKWTSIADVASNGPGNVATPKPSASVGATGDNAANNGPGNQSPSATSKVGATGDNAAKRGN